jgi:hypothetical protein
VQLSAQIFKAVNDTVDLYPGVPKTVNLLANDTVPFGDSLRITGGNSGSLPLISITNRYLGFLTYLVKPLWGFNGNLTGNYTIYDLTLGKSTSADILFRIHDHSYDSLDINNVKAAITAYGNQFQLFATESSLFRIPKESQTGTIFNLSLWMGGKGDDSLLYLAADKYRQGPGIAQPGSCPDFFAGPVMDSVNYSIYQDTVWSRTWKVTKSEIEYHKTHWNSQGYVAPPNIVNWPGNGNTAYGQAADLAPYHDTNGDGKYNAADGDYPSIMGDEAVFTIYNDDRDIHKESGGKKMRIEIHLMAYAFDMPGDSAFKNTIFLNYKIFNRSPRTYYNTYLGVFGDLDIGYGLDDYICCDVGRSSFIGYNGLAVDGTGQTNAYGAHPPAQSVTILRGPFMDPVGHDRPRFDNEGHQLCNESINGTGFGDSIANNERYGLTNFLVPWNFAYSQYHYSDPLIASEYYHTMQSIWCDSTHLFYGGQGHAGYGGYGPDCRFILPGESDSLNWGPGCQLPDGPVNWTEYTAGIAPYDIRGIGGMGPFTFHPGDVQELDLALVFARDYISQDTVEQSVAKLRQMIDTIRKSYNTGLLPNGNSFFGIDNQPSASFTALKIYPNPANKEITIETSSTPAASQLSIMNLNGQQLITRQITQPKTQLDISSLPSGVYFVRLTNNKTVEVRKFVKE